jgi:Leucine-rich repeat (LRR) protein
MLLSSLLISCAQCKSIWSQDLPVLYHVTLEQGKPLQVQHCYTKLQLMDLNGTLDAQFLSQLAPVTHLRLYLTRITKIEAGAVCTFPTLRRFELSFKEDAKVPILRRNIFENCEQLEELSLVGSYGNPSKLEPNTFLDLVNLKNLSLMYLDLHHLKKEYFGGLKSLTHLDIAQCNVQQIDEDTFYELDSLKQLTVFFQLKVLPFTNELVQKCQKFGKIVPRREQPHGLDVGRIRRIVFA